MSNFLVATKFAIVVFFIFSLSGCSFLGFGDYFRDRSSDYRLSEETGTIVVPERLDADGIGELYPVPAAGEVVRYQIDAEFVTPRPRSVVLNDAANEVKIQRLAGASWILMSAPSSEAWPRIRSYLTRNGIPTAKADASRGVIETGLFELSDEEGVYQQFLISLSQGVQLNTTEIEILQRAFSSERAVASLPDWAGRSEDVDKEEWLRKGLATDLADETITGSSSLLGQAIGSALKVELITPIDELPYIEMRMEFARAWASVGHALGKDGFSIAEGETGNEFYLVHYQEPMNDTKQKLWRRVLLQKNTNKSPAESYRVDVKNTEEGAVQVRLKRLYDSEMTQRENYQMLLKIRNNLA